MNKPKTIYFYNTVDEFGALSNFAKYPLTIDSKIWPTSEHYFQAQKFPHLPDYQEKIRASKSAHVAAQLGRSRDVILRKDWENVKEDIMMTVLKIKFTQHNKLKELLVSTQDAILVEHTSNDNYWADGGDGKGKNRLGILLMKLRGELK